MTEENIEYYKERQAQEWADAIEEGDKKKADRILGRENREKGMYNFIGRRKHKHKVLLFRRKVPKRNKWDLKEESKKQEEKEKVLILHRKKSKLPKQKAIHERDPAVASLKKSLFDRNPIEKKQKIKRHKDPLVKAITKKRKPITREKKLQHDKDPLIKVITKKRKPVEKRERRPRKSDPLIKKITKKRKPVTLKEKTIKW